MSELKQQYKNPHPGFGNVDHRILRDYKHVESLKEMRTRAFYDNRDLVNISVASPQSAENVPPTNRRLRRYKKWKKERNKRRKLQNAKTKQTHSSEILTKEYINAERKLDLKTEDFGSSGNDISAIEILIKEEPN